MLPFVLLPVGDGDGGSDGRMVGEQRGRNGRRNCHCVMGRKEGMGGVGPPEQQVWGKAGLALSPTFPNPCKRCRERDRGGKSR